MYQVKIKGRNLEELKKAVSDINDELNGGKLPSNIEKNMESIKDQAITEMQSEEVPERLKEMEEVPEVIPTPVTPVVTPTVVPINPNVELDSEGLPWDARIHNSKRTKVKAGSWKIRKGTDRDLVAQVLNELRSAMLTQPVTPVVLAPLVPVVPVAPPTDVIAQTINSLNTPDPTPTPVVEIPVEPVPLPTQASGHTFETFKAGFITIIGTLISEGKLKQEYVNTLVEYFKVDQIWSVNDEQKLQMFEGFAQKGLISKVG